MRKILLFVCLAAFSFSSAKAQIWVEQNSNLPNISEGIRDIFAVNDSVVWIIGYDGSGGGMNVLDYAVSSDGGNNFTNGTVGSDTTYQFSNITAVNADSAWVAMFDHNVGTGGGIWATSDGGANWTQQGVGTMYDANSFPDVVYFWNANEGVTIGDPNNGYFEIYTTTDGGTNWTRVPTGNIPNELSGEAGITDWYEVYGNDIWFYTSKGRVFHSADKGYTWTVGTVVNLPSTQAMIVKFFDANNGIAQIYLSATAAFVSAKKTNDGGATWTAITPTGNIWASDMAVIPNTGVIVSTGAAQGFSGSSFSLDSGLTWTDIDNGIQHTALAAVSYNGMWSGGFSGGFQSGGIFKYDGYNLGVPNGPMSPKSYNMYPNPSSGIISLNLKTTTASILYVTDAMGKIVYSSEIPVTTGQRSFDLSALAKGIYSLTVTSAKQIMVQEKLVLQ